MFDRLINLETTLSFSDSHLYYKLPIYLNNESEFKKSDVIFISKEYGIFLFKCIEDTERTFDNDTLSNIIDEFEDIYSLIFSKLLKSRLLRNSPSSINVQIIPILFFGNFSVESLPSQSNWEELRIINPSCLKKTINAHECQIESEKIKEIIAVLEGSKGLSGKKKENTSKVHLLRRVKLLVLLKVKSLPLIVNRKELDLI